MALMLNDNELRVLGVLIEKSLTHSGSYPLTLNAIVLGANQKQNRDPVTNLCEADVGRALHTLERKDLVKHAAPAPAARANRFEHNVVERFHWDRREQAVMAELMLRGRQTAGELRARAGRMTPLQDVEAVSAILRGLAAGDPVFVEELPREPGRGANRFRHLLSTEAETVPAPAAAGEDAADSEAALEADPLAERVARLEDQVAYLNRILEDLQKNHGGGIDRSDLPSI